MSKKQSKKRRWRVKAGIRRFSRQTLIIVLTVAVTVVFAGYIALLIMLKGPSPTFSDLLVSTMWETRRGKAVVRAMFSEDEIEAMLSKNSFNSSNETVEITSTDTTDFNIPENEKDDVTIEDVSGGTFEGKMMIVRDPSRIKLGYNSLMPDASKGYSVMDYVSYYNGVAGINAGGFEDPGGKGDGSAPYGDVILNGELVYGRSDDYYCMIGFNQQNHLIAGNMTPADAISWGIRDAVTFGPLFIYNGEVKEYSGTGGGLNPRTVIGQKADGSVLLLVIDGRQPQSIGASYEDCIKVMLQYGAVVAANLDGGSSSVMVYDGQIINSVVSMNGDRSVPTAWVVQ